MIDFRIIRSDRYTREGRPKSRRKFGRRYITDDIQRLPMRTFSMWHRDHNHFVSYCKADYGETVKYLYSRIGIDYNETYSDLIKKLSKKTIKRYIFREELRRMVQQNDVVLNSVYYRKPRLDHYGFYLDSNGILRYSMYYNINRWPSKRKRSEVQENFKTYNVDEVFNAVPIYPQYGWIKLKNKYYVQTFMDGLIIPEKLPVYAIGFQSVCIDYGKLPGVLRMFEPVMISGVGYYQSFIGHANTITRVVFLVKTKNIEKWRKKKSKKLLKNMNNP